MASGRTLGIESQPFDGESIFPGVKEASRTHGNRESEVFEERHSHIRTTYWNEKSHAQLLWLPRGKKK